MNDLISVTNGKLKVVFHPIGAAIYAIYFNDELMTLTPTNPDDFLKENIFHGKTVGPICGRIKNGELSIKNKKYYYDKNEGNNTLHGGKDGLSTKRFSYRLIKNGIVFSYGDGNSKYFVKYLVSFDSLLIKFVVNCKENTPISLTNHTFFCLGDGNLNKLKLTIPAKKFIEVDSSDLIPLKEREIIPCLDFNNEKLISQNINDKYLVDSKTNGYDHPFIFSKEKKAFLSNDRYKLEISTSFKTILIYSDNYNDGVKMMNSDQMVRRGVAIEPQDHQLHRKTYKKYNRYIEYKFSKI